MYDLINKQSLKSYNPTGAKLFRKGRASRSEAFNSKIDVRRVHHSSWKRAKLNREHEPKKSKETKAFVTVALHKEKENVLIQKTKIYTNWLGLKFNL